MRFAIVRARDFAQGRAVRRAVPELTVEIHLTPGQVLQYYRGQARSAQARAVTGQLVEFPASALQRHVTPEGVHGRFRLEFGADRKFLRLERVDGG